MQVDNLYKWVSSSYKEASKRLDDARGEIKSRLNSVVSSGPLEVKELMKTFGEVQKQVMGLKVQLEDRFVRKFEAVLELLGIPSEREMNELKVRVEKLGKKIAELRKSSNKAPSN